MGDDFVAIAFSFHILFKTIHDFRSHSKPFKTIFSRNPKTLSLPVRFGICFFVERALRLSDWRKTHIRPLSRWENIKRTSISKCFVRIKLWTNVYYWKRWRWDAPFPKGWNNHFDLPHFEFTSQWFDISKIVEKV